MSAVIYEKRGNTAWITLNRPEAHNTLNGDMFLELNDAWLEVREDSDVRAIVVTAAGEQDFCCGGDLGSVIPLWTGAKQPETDIERRLLAEKNIVSKVLLRQKQIIKPIICAVNGRALGGGCELLQATDIRISVGDTVFGLPEPKVGVVPGGGSMVRLPRQIPWAQAMKILLTGEPVSAYEALQMGLITEIVDRDQLLDRAQELADKICKLAPLAVQAIKRTALQTEHMSWPDAFAFEDKEAKMVMMTKDAREGPKAFMEKRKPNFLGG
jgi:enoyl-CoA hydratase